ncbi:haloalkane dehalogenase [Capronia epimyces CBS 606.96]|uniref:Haloalkane dehalogenase n=1 Tax=Capronia epimyces CBS 606.96 TaxID=1182542 RepID=W9YBM6_9EURO|nr:haloalkane dehalogenase [Capronia epimyces CBS 606.96]EXJ79764.1 haloalkane dehalogenase [Capronia epimyces CBS 606.96]
MYITLPNHIKVYYREAGSPTKPTILLLHGFPSSSHQFRKLMPTLAAKYYVVAPDLPGFGFTEVPAESGFIYSFANIADTIGSFLDTLKITKFAVYIFDYGAPTAFRLALERPDAITAIVSQNGNAYDEGLAPFWESLRELWAAPHGSDEEKKVRESVRDAVLTFEATKAQYLVGEPEAEKIDDPASYHLDWALLSRPGNQEIQLDLFKDYASNVALYPKFQEYLRNTQVPVLAVWGKNDFIFAAPGGEAFKRDVKDAKVVLLDGGHFSSESHAEEIGHLILEFLQQHRI